MSGGTTTAPYAFAAGDYGTAARLNTRSTAIADLQSPPRCHAYQVAAQTLTNNVTTAVTLDAEEVDTEGIHSTVTNNSRMTIVTPGRYRAIGQVGFTAATAGTTRVVQLRRTGGVIAENRVFSITATHIMQVYDEILCVAGDYIEVHAQQSSGGNLNVVAGSSTTFLHVVWCGLT